MARVKAHADSGRHFAVLSAERSNLSPSENKARHEHLKKHLATTGYGHREVEGHYEGGKEKSIMVHAKGTGNAHGKRLLKDMKAVGAKYGQDSVLHHNGRKATLHGTNKSGWPGKGKRAGVGKIAHNRPTAPFQTETKPTRGADKPVRPKDLKRSASQHKASARFTTEELNTMENFFLMLEQEGYQMGEFFTFE